MCAQVYIYVHICTCVCVCVCVSVSFGGGESEDSIPRLRFRACFFWAHRIGVDGFRAKGLGFSGLGFRVKG